ncbi:MAG: alpha/beta hydrolase [Syntrophobacteraceae bacterium]
MPELTLKIPIDTFDLEALFEDREGEDAAIICHPHPRYGGNMQNNVVQALKKVLWSKGWATLRFNYRGVGASGGRYGDGEGEVLDLLAVESYLRQQGKKRIHIAGYSFGAWIVLGSVKKGLQANSLILISPPVDNYPFDDLFLPSAPCLFVLGGSDQYCDAGSLGTWIETHSSVDTPVDVEVIPNGDHFYWSREGSLSIAVETFLEKRF